MGKNFDPEVMSIRKPHDLASHPNGTVKFPFKRNKKGRLVPTGEVFNKNLIFHPYFLNKNIRMK